jgi:hypothetical protein
VRPGLPLEIVHKILGIDVALMGCADHGVFYFHIVLSWSFVLPLGPRYWLSDALHDFCSGTALAAYCFYHHFLSWHLVETDNCFNCPHCGLKVRGIPGSTVPLWGTVCKHFIHSHRDLVDSFILEEDEIREAGGRRGFEPEYFRTLEVCSNRYKKAKKDPWP